MLNTKELHFILLGFPVFGLVLSYKECQPTAWDDMFAFVGDQFLTRMKSELRFELGNCLNVDQPRELKFVRKKCGTDSMFSLMGELAKRSWVVSPYDLMTWFEEGLFCKLDSAGVKYNYTTLDVPSYVDKMKLEEWSGDKEDLEIYKEIVKICTENVTLEGGTALLQVVSIDKCISRNMIIYCYETKDKIGLSVRLMFAFYTLLEESPCKAVKVPETVSSGFKDCFEKSKMEYDKSESRTDQIFDEVRELSVGEALKFIGDYFLVMVVKTNKCFNKNLGIYNEDDGSTKYAALAKIVEKFSGWENISKEQDAMHDAIIHCSFRDPMAANLGKYELLLKMAKNKVNFQKCFGLTFASICGINNDLAKFFYPILDSKVVEMYTEHYKTLPVAQPFARFMKPMINYFVASLSIGE